MRLLDFKLNPFGRGLVVVMICVALAMPVKGDDPDLDKLGKLLDELHEELDELMEDVADEYVDILDQIEDIIDDYSEYYDEEEIDRKFLSENGLSFDPISRKLSRGRYVDKPKELQSDLGSFVSNLKRMAGNSNSGTIRGSHRRVFRNLRRELSILDERVGEYILAQSAQQRNIRTIREYVESALTQVSNESAQEETHKLWMQLAELDETNIKLAIELKERVMATDELKQIVISIPDIPPVPPVADVPGVSPIGIDRGEWEGLHRSFADSLSVSSSRSKIYVVNPMGNVRVTGWDRPMITAFLQIQVVSKSRSAEESFLERSNLTVARSERGYEVQASFPPLQSTRTRLVQSSLVVRVPRSIASTARNAFGNISISDLSGGVSVFGNQSEINLDQISGGALVENSTGAIRLTDISGSLDVKCAYGTIEMTDCHGQTNIENTYSNTQIYDCSGDASLRGNGDIFVQGFTGHLDITNSYGPVEVRQVDGDLVVANAYDVLTVRDISGSAELDNSYSKISVYKIDGALSASNTQGLIFAEALGGPVDLENVDGAIKVVFNRSLGGTSRIRNSGGAIDVAFLRRGDFVLAARTDGGAINSHLPLEFSSDGRAKVASISFGRGLDSLILIGENSVINIIETD